MRWLQLLYLISGLALLGYVLFETDLTEVWGYLDNLGWGIAVILVITLVDLFVDTAAWALSFPRSRLNRAWLLPLWRLRMVGDAFNNLTPLGGIGGEPLKAALLKAHHGTPYREAIASVVLAKTTLMLALLVFLAGGLFFMLRLEAVPRSLALGAGAGYGFFTVGVLLFFIFQRRRWFSRAVARIARPSAGGALATVLERLREIEDLIVDFYTRSRARFGATLAVQLVNWLFGVVEVYYTIRFLGHPISIGDAWVIEAMVQLVRAATFFVPASIGAQEGGLVLVCAAVTGDPALGLAASAVRRAREIFWILWGLALAWLYSLGRSSLGSHGTMPGGASAAGRADDS